MERTDKKIERIKEELNKLHHKVLVIKKAKMNSNSKKFIKLKNWKQFRANVNKEDKTHE